MLAVVIPILSRTLTNEWPVHCWMLERVLDSIVRQSDDDTTAVVVCHETPATAYANHPRVKYLPVDFALPRRNNDDMCADKALKLTVGCKWAIDNNFDYVMFSDADDSVSNRIPRFVRDNPNVDGWFIQFVLSYAYGSRWVRLRRIPDGQSSAAAIFRCSRLTFDSPPFAGKWTAIQLQAGNAEYLGMLAERGRTVNTLAGVGLAHFQEQAIADGYRLAPLPFPAILKINHPYSMSHIPGGSGYARSRPETLRERIGDAKRRLLGMRSARPLTKVLREEFAIPNSIPPDIAGIDSTFSR